MSKLVKKLRQVSENTVQPLGFRTAPPTASRQMLLIVSVPQGHSGTIAQLASTEIDAILIDNRNLKGAADFGHFAADAGDVPVGLWLDLVSEEYLEQFKQAGGDFLVFESGTAPATLLQEEELGKVLRVDPSQDESLLCAIDQLPIEVVLFDVKSEGNVLTISDLMYCQWLAGLVDKPLVVAAQQGLTDKEIRSLMEVGVRGIVVELQEKQIGDSLARLSQAIKTLPPKTKKLGEKKALLPRLGYGYEEPEEPEET
jgi:hypothetical protein